jgi:hypothetical protein
MRMALVTLTAPLAACVAAPPAPQPPVARADVAAVLEPIANGGVSVTRTGTPGYAMWDGASAKRDADALCGPRGVRTSIYDRFAAGAWVFVGGCA